MFSGQKTLITPECQRPRNDTKAAHKKERVVSIIEGKFYCIYLVAENGQKILLNRIPTDYIKKLSKPMNYNVLASGDRNARIAMYIKQQMGILEAHKQNILKIMDILQKGHGI